MDGGGIFLRYSINSIDDANKIVKFLDRLKVLTGVCVPVWSPISNNDVYECIKQFFIDIESFKTKPHKRLSRLFRRKDAALSEALDFYDIHLAASDESGLYEAFKKHRVALTERMSLVGKKRCLNNAKLIVFCLTKSYVESELIEKHIIEAEKENKEIVFIFLEKELPPTKKLTNVDFVKIRRMGGKNEVIRLWNYAQWQLIDDHCEYLEEYKYILLFETIQAILDVKLPIQYTYKYQACFLYTSSTSQIDSVLSDTKSFSIWSQKCLKNRNNKNLEILEAISQSKMIVFFLTNEYIKSEHFEREVAYANKLSKPIVPVLVENIDESVRGLIDLDLFKVIDVSDDGRLSGYMRKMFKPKLAKPIESVNYIKTLGYRYVHLVRMKSKFILINGLELLELCPSRKSFVQLPFRLPYFSTETLIFYCWVEHLGRLCAITTKRNAFVMFDEEFKFIDYKDTQPHEMRKNTHLVYCALNKRTYSYALDGEIVGLFDCDLNFERELRLNVEIGYLQIVNDKAYVIDTNCGVSVFDLHFNYLHSLDQHMVIKPKSVFSDSTNSNFIYFETADALQVFNVHSYNYVGEIAKPILFYSMTISDYVSCDFHFYGELLVCTNYLYLPVYLFEFEYRLSGNKPVYSSYVDSIESVVGVDAIICTINPSRYHVYREPYELPCGNKVCLECIHENINLLTNRFKCNFESCQMEHELKRQSVQKCDENMQATSRELLKYTKKVLNSDMDFKNQVEKRFTLIENAISSRISALKSEFEQIGESTIDDIEKTISMKSKKYALRLRFKCTINKKLTLKTVGVLKKDVL